MNVSNIWLKMNSSKGTDIDQELIPGMVQHVLGVLESSVANVVEEASV